MKKINARINELEAIEQPLEVILAGDGGDFGSSEYVELKTLRGVLAALQAAPAQGRIDTPAFLAMLDAYCTDGTNGYEHHYRKIVAHIAQRAASGDAPDWQSQRKIIERAVIGLRDGWATRADADAALAALNAAPAPIADEVAGVPDAAPIAITDSTALNGIKWYVQPPEHLRNGMNLYFVPPKASAPDAPAGEFPPLPKGPYADYGADDMRAYVLADRAAAAPDRKRVGDVEDALSDLRKAVLGGASDEWLAGFIRQYPFAAPAGHADKKHEAMECQLRYARRAFDQIASGEQPASFAKLAIKHIWCDHSGQPAGHTEPVARLQTRESDRPYSKGMVVFEVIILDPTRCFDQMELFAAPVATSLINPKD